MDCLTARNMTNTSNSKVVVRSKLHHYVPQFLLSRWKRSCDERIHVFRRRPTGELFDAWFLPREVGAQNHLWSLNSSEFSNRSAIEDELFSPLDTQAAIVLEKIERWSPTFNDKDREVWAVFVASLLVRCPATINHLKSEVPRWLRESAATLDQDLSDQKQTPISKKLRDQAKMLMPGENSAARLTEHIMTTMSEYVNDLAMLQTVNLVLDEANLTRFHNMTWFVRKITKSNRNLLIGDMPMTRIFSVADPRCVLAFPLSPTSAFVASRNNAMLNYFNDLNDRQFVEHLNRNATGLARRFVVGDCEKKFLERWFLKESGR